MVIADRDCQVESAGRLQGVFARGDVVEIAIYIKAAVCVFVDEELGCTGVFQRLG